MLGKKYRIKSGFVFTGYVGMLVFLGYRLFSIQFLQYGSLQTKAENLHQIEIKLEPRRGNITDRNENILAGSIHAPSLYADPTEIKNPETTAEKLAPLLGLNKEFLYKQLTKEKRFVWLKRKLTKELKESVSKLSLPGIYFLDEPMRFYPKGKLASHILGFVNIDSEGMEGIELACDNFLRGKEGVRITEKDAVGREVLGWRNKEVLPVDGYKIILTIDEVIQYIVEEELDKAMVEYNPRSGIVVVMDPVTSEILALSNRPSFNPNEYTTAKNDAIRNRAITDCFEPGSVYKIFAAAAALEEGLFNLNDTIFCENGTYKVPGGVLHDHRPHGTLTFQQVIEKSSNIGMAKTGQKLGRDRLYSYLSDFGFGKPTGITLPGEIPGTLWAESRWSAMSITRIPMGHEVSVTALQIARATCAVANGGHLMTPLIIKRIIDSKGGIIKEYKPTVIRDVVSDTATKKLKTALCGVVTPKGTALKAALKNFPVAGKTGTAQKINPDGTYSHSDYVASFVGFVPADNPAVVVLVVFDSPKPLYYGGVTAAPVFKNIAERVLGYMDVTPENNAPLSGAATK